MTHVIAPILFVLIWSTGFIVGKAALPHADLQLYLLARFVLTAAVMGLAAAIARAQPPRLRDIGPHLLAGIFMQGFYLCLSYWAIERGMPAGVMSLLGALQPLFTALFLVTAVGIRLGARTWAGLGIGFAGVGLVLLPKLTASAGQSLSLLSVLLALLSVVSLTGGSLVQTWLQQTDIRVAASLQSMGAAGVALIMSLALGSDRWDGSVMLYAILVWAVLVPSMIGTTLLMWMMRHGDADKVTALILAVPPLAAVQAWFFFNETLLPLQFAGFALALAGVLLARSAPAVQT